MVDPELGAVESGRTGCAVKNDTGRMVRVGVESGSDGGLVVAVAPGPEGVCAFNHDKGGTVCGGVDDAIGVVHGGLVVVVAPGRTGVGVLLLGCACANGGEGGKGGMVCGGVDGEEPELAPGRAVVALVACASTNGGKGGKDEAVCGGVDGGIGDFHCALVVVVAPGRGCDNESDDCAVDGDGTIELLPGRMVSVACVTEAEPLGLGTLASVCDGGVSDADCTVDVVVLLDGAGVMGDEGPNSARLETQKITAIAASTLKSSSPRSDPTPLVEPRAATELISVILTTFFAISTPKRLLHCARRSLLY
jgi:hypothetical protein